MIRTPPVNGLDPSLPPPLPIAINPRELTLDERLALALPIKQQLDRLLSWRERVSPEVRQKVRRGYSAACLLFQFVGLAGYAGYFASMHTFMRLFSGALMLGGWYAIFWLKREFSNIK